MRLQSLPVWALALSAFHASEVAACKSMLDKDSTLVTSISSAADFDLSWFPFADVFDELHHSLPWLSTCAAAMDPVMVYTSFATSSNAKACLATMEASEVNMDLDNSAAWSGFCSLVEDTVVPCIKNAMTEIVMDAFASTGGCCDAYLNKMEALFTDSVDVMVEKIVEFMANILCAERSFTNLKGEATTEMCGYSIFQAFTVFDPAHVLDLLQIPNEQMCEAMNGSTFTTTNGSTTQFTFGSEDVDTMGICSQTVDAFTKHLASWPFFQQTLDANGTAFSLSNWFATGKSIPASTLFTWFLTPSNLPMMVMRTAEKVSEAVDAHFGSGSDVEGEHSDTWDSFDWASSYISDLSASWGSSRSQDEDEIREPDATTAEWRDPSAKDDGDEDAVQFVEGAMNYVGTLKLHIPNEGNCVHVGEAITLPFAVSTSTTTSSSSDGSIALAVEAQASVAARAIAFQTLMVASIVTAMLVVMGLAI